MGLASVWDLRTRIALQVVVLLSLQHVSPRTAVAATTIGPSGPVIAAPQSSTIILNGVSYRATSGGATIFETGNATLSADGTTLTFALTGSGAGGASVQARVTMTANGVIVDWMITTNFTDAWTDWNTGFTVQMPQPRSAARMSNVIAWKTPTGAYSWENPGDTPYPDNEFQVRQIDSAGWTLAWVSSHYDANWFYARFESDDVFDVHACGRRWNDQRANGVLRHRRIAHRSCRTRR